MMILSYDLLSDISVLLLVMLILLHFFPFSVAVQIFFCDLRRLYFFNRLAGMSLQQAKGGTGFQFGRSNRLLLHFSYALHHFLVQNVPDNQVCFGVYSSTSYLAGLFFLDSQVGQGCYSSILLKMLGNLLSIIANLLMNSVYIL